MIHVITDGNAGNVTQARGLATALERHVGAMVRDHVIVLPRIVSALPNRGLAVLPSAALRLPSIRGGDLIVGAGRRGNLAAARLRRPGRAAVAILDPQMDYGAFDAVIVPQHDGITGDPVIETLGAMNGLTPELIAEAGRALALPKTERRVLACLIGGPSRSAGFDDRAIDTLIRDIALFADWHVRITTSRRTPGALVNRLATLPAHIFPWPPEHGAPNAYPGLLHDADAVLVTEDSVNMVSEAAATGKPVFVSGNGQIKPKLQRFHAAMSARGITRPARDGPAAWHYPPLCEADRVATVLSAQLGWAS